MKKFRWTVEIEIDETWVADGFDLTDERAHNIMCTVLGHATSSEIRCRVTKRPPMADVNAAQGAPRNRQRKGWPKPTSPDNPRFLVTSIVDGVFGIVLDVNGNGDGNDLNLGVAASEYMVKVGDVVEYRKPGDRTVYCVDFDSGWSAYPEYDTRQRP